MAKKTTKTITTGKKNSPGNLRRRIFIAASAILLAGFALLFLLFGAVYIGLFGKLPDEESIRNITQHNASEVYSADGQLLGKYFIENRSSINYSDIPQFVIDALVATEDSRFFEHEGIDIYSIPRVVIKTLILGDKSAGGGSTISQQLAKNLYGRHDHGALSMPVNKLKENITALKIEDVYSKEEIVTLYLNTVSFGENVYGIKSAAYRYFGKLPSQLTVPEAATLIGLLKANTAYNPRLYPDASLERRNTVLALMVREGTLEPEAFSEFENQPIKLNYRRDDGHQAPAPYLRAYLEPRIKELLEAHNREDGKPYNLYTDGLKITLTIHGTLQAFAEKALASHLAKLQESFDQHWSKGKPWGNKEDFLWKQAAQSVRYQRLVDQGKSEKQIREAFLAKTQILRYTPQGPELVTMTPLDSVAWHQMVLQAGFVALDVNTGKVLAYAGGQDFGYFPYDHVQGRRQAGSTFKPFVYTAALESGMGPCDYVENSRLIFSEYDDWSPSNSGQDYGGYYTLQGGLAKSVNTIAAQLMAQVGPSATAEVAKRLGIESRLPDLPSIALGVADVSLLEMVASYAPFANGGNKIRPWYIEKIETSGGKVLYEGKSRKNTKVLDSNIAATMRQMLQLAVDSGTAQGLRSRYGVGIAIGGKTGTTQNNADGWFIAVTPNVAMGAWVGGQSPVVRFRSTSLGQGAATAMPIVAAFTKSAEKEPVTRKIMGRSFSPPAVYDPCPLYTDTIRNGFFDNLFDRESREERRARKEQDRLEPLQEPEKTKEQKEKEERWMNRLLEKLKQKRKEPPDKP